MDDVQPTVCVTHARHVPCRKQGDHVLSTDPADVARVSRHQREGN